jgi:cobyrinic acid a,c-diamide synthase
MARDDAFCFVYDDTERLFRNMGAEIEYFSPLAGEEVPADADGLLLPGGYPELHAEELENSVSSRESVKNAVDGGMPTIAECGGFQYLGEELAGRKMCGVLPHSSFDTGKLVRFGYVAITAGHDGLLGPGGTQLRTHEFHYWDSTDNGTSFHAVKPNGRNWDCGVMTDTLYAGYPHLYLMSCIPAAEAFYRKCLEYKKGRERTCSSPTPER